MTCWAKPFPRAHSTYCVSSTVENTVPPKSHLFLWVFVHFVIFLVPTLSSFVDYCATTPVLGGGLSPPNHTQSRTHWVNADISDAQSDTRFKPGTLGSPVRCLDHYNYDAMSRIMNKPKCEQWFYKQCKLKTEHTLNIQLLSIIVYRKITQFVLHSAIRDCTDGD